MKKFWTCWVDGTTGGYGYRHSTFEDAQHEAKRLAVLQGNDGKAVYVLEYVGRAISERVKWETPETDRREPDRQR